MNITKKVIFYFIFLFICSFLVNKFSVKLIFDRTSYETPPGIPLPLRSTILPFLNYDGRNYLNIVLYGYPQNDKMLAFFPLYPLLIRILSLNLLVNPIIIGLLLSATSSILACIFFYKLIKLEYSEKIAQKSLLLLIFFPSSVYFFAYYPEGLFLLFSILTFWFIKKKNLFLATVFVCLATATKLIGLALIPVLLYEGFVHFKKTGKLPWTILISPMGFISFGLFIYFKFGNFFYILYSQTDQSFGRSLQLLNPVLAYIHSFQRVLSGPKVGFDNIFVYPVIVFELVLGLFELIVLFLSFKIIPMRYWIYVFFSVSIVLFSGVLSANVRNLLVVFPIYIFLALKLDKKSFPAWLTLSLVLFLLVSLIFLRGYWIA